MIANALTKAVRVLLIVIFIVISGVIANYFLLRFVVGPLVWPVPYYFGRTSDSTPVDVSLQDNGQTVRFRIPKNYMTFSENWEGGPQSLIQLQVIFPSMVLVSTTWKSSDDMDVMIITLSSHAGGNPRMLQTYYIPKQWKLREHIPGYDVYIEKEPLEIIPERLRSEYLVPTDGNSEIYFDCGGGAPRCSGYTNFGENLTVRITFERKLLLEKWKEIRGVTFELLNHFRARANFSR